MDQRSDDTRAPPAATARGAEDPPTDDELDALLARGRLSGARRERIFEAALARAGAAEAEAPAPTAAGAGAGSRLAFWRRWRLLYLTPLAAAAAAILFFLVPRSGVDPTGGFTARGGGPAGAGRPLLEVSCLPAAPTAPGSGSAGAGLACRVGSKLVFRVSGAVEGGHLAAFAVPAGGHGEAGGGQRIWYFPAGGAAPPRVPASSAPHTLPVGARLGPEHAPGAHQVVLVLSRVPLERAQVLDAARDGVGDAVLAVERVRLEVVP